jgi:pilus assembly protein TadC
MNLKQARWLGIGIGLLIIASSFIFYGDAEFYIIIGIGIIIGISPYISLTIVEGKINGEKEQMFLEFARDLVESVKSGTPVSKSIINVKERPYGILGKHIRKLANQISLGIPLGTALQIFSKDVDNKTISRALTLIGEAERAGGSIGEILESVAGAVRMSDKLKKERKATISALVIQGYIIFFIFLIIIVVMQFKILPMVSGIANLETIGVTGTNIGGGEEIDFSQAFLYLLLVQGFFSGLAIGLLAEGNLKAGIKHSFALMLSAFLVSAISNVVAGL